MCKRQISPKVPCGTFFLNFTKVVRKHRSRLGCSFSDQNPKKMSYDAENNAIACHEAIIKTLVQNRKWVLKKDYFFSSEKNLFLDIGGNVVKTRADTALTHGPPYPKCSARKRHNFPKSTTFSAYLSYFSNEL